MPVIRDVQNAFNQGELSPLLLGRGDLSAYHAGVRSLENFVPLRPGGLERRSGTVFVASLKDPTSEAALVRFHVSINASYGLVFESGIFRVVTQGGVLLLQDSKLDHTTDLDVSTNELSIFNHGYSHDSGPFRIILDSGGTPPTGLAEGTDYYVNLPQSVQVTNVQTGSDYLKAINNFSENMGPFQVTTGAGLPNGLKSETDYYVISVTPLKFKLSLTPGGAPVNVTSKGSGGLSLIPTDYYLRSKVRLSATVGGPIIDISAIGNDNFTLDPTGIQIAEFAHPFEDDELSNIRTAQTADIAYVVTGQSEPYRILRYSPRHWAVSKHIIDDGPYLIQQHSLPSTLHAGVTMNPGSTTGDRVTVTASTALFVGTDVGRALRIGASDVLEQGWGRIISVPSMTFTNPGQFSIINEGINPGADIYEIDDLTITDGEAITVDRDQYGLVQGTVYFLANHPAVAPEDSEMSFHLTHADALRDENRVNLTFGSGTTTATQSWIEVEDHGLTNRHGPVTLSSTGSLPSGLSDNTAYWVNVGDEDHISLSLTPGGEIVIMTDNDGSGTHTIYGETIPSSTCEVKIYEPYPLSTAQERWRMSSFGSHPSLGWPKTVGLHEQRVVYGGPSGQPQTLFFSRAADFNNFSPDVANSEDDHIVTSESGIVFDLVSEEVNTIEWAVPLQTLLVGTTGGIWAIHAGSANESLTPSNINGKRQSRTGSDHTQPVAMGDAVIFVSEGRRTIRGARFNFEQNAVLPADLMLLADHLGEPALFDRLALTGAPRDLAWVRRADGILLSLTYDPSQNVAAWSKHTFGPSAAGDAVVETFTTISTPDGENDQVWMVTKRTVNGEVRRDIEYIVPRFHSGIDPEDAHFVDSGVIGSDASGKTVWDGLDHLEGESVQVLADGARVADQVVASGQITLSSSAKDVHIGLGYTSTCQLMPIELQSTSTSNRQIAMLTKRVIRAMIRIFRTGSISVGPTTDSLVEVDMRSLRSDKMDTPAALRSGTVDLPSGSGYEKDGGFAFGATGPLPATVIQSAQRVEYSDR